MIVALLDGRKTQTRRVLPNLPSTWDVREIIDGTVFAFKPGFAGEGHVKLRYAPGDRLWVRESGWISKTKTAFVPSVGNEQSGKGFQSPDGESFKSCPSIHMPRWASRLTLIVEAVKVERLTDISEADAQAEGVEPVLGTPGVPLDRHYAAFMQLWDSLHGEGATYFNPWVVAVSFRVVRGNIDKIIDQREVAA